MFRKVIPRPGARSHEIVDCKIDSKPARERLSKSLDQNTSELAKYVYITHTEAFEDSYDPPNTPLNSP